MLARDVLFVARDEPLHVTVTLRCAQARGPRDDPSLTLGRTGDDPLRSLRGGVTIRPSHAPGPGMAGPGRDDRFIGYRPYLARRASAFSRQAAASCGKLVAAAFRRRAAMMRRIRAARRLQWRRTGGRWRCAAAAGAARAGRRARPGAGGDAGRRRAAGSRRAGGAGGDDRSAGPGGRCAGRRWCAGGRGRRPAGRPGSSRRACGRGRQAARSWRSSSGRSARWSRSPLPHLHRPLAVGLAGEGRVGLELGQQGAAVAGTDPGGFGQASTGHRLVGGDQGGVGLAGALALAGLVAGLLLVLGAGGRADGGRGAISRLSTAEEPSSHTGVAPAVRYPTRVGGARATWSRVDRATEATSSSHDSRSTARCPSRLASRTLTSMARARADERCYSRSELLVCGARGRIRTDDLPITSRTEAFQLDPPRTILAAQARDQFHPVPSCVAW
jgi:hypothetical protein